MQTFEAKFYSDEQFLGNAKVEIDEREHDSISGWEGRIIGPTRISFGAGSLYRVELEDGRIAHVRIKSTGSKGTFFISSGKITTPKM